jgi:hypothetical protein
MPEITTPPGNIPKSETNTLKLERFRGIDLTSGVVNVHETRSPDAVNIMPDEDGFPKKRPGWKVRQQYPGRIWAAHRFVAAGGEETLLVHAGQKLYSGDVVVFDGMAEATSVSVQLGAKLWLLDGQTYLYYDGESCAPVSEIATVPMVTIAKAPNGDTGATSYQAVNLLTGKRTDSYLGTATDKKYVLSFNGLTELPVEAKKLNADGEWVVIEAAGYTVDRVAGPVSFTIAPGVSPVEGEDNVRITYEVEASGAGKVNGCRLMILYGVKGALDRVFMSGNPDEVNVDYWSDHNDPAYMGDVFYGMVGQDASPIIGYNVLGSRLVTLKKNEENGRNIFLREGSLDDEGFATFELTGVMQGEGAISGQCFASLASEPLYLSSRGVQALTPSDVTGERYAQGRSFYIDGGLLREGGLENACAVSWGRFYVLAVNGKLYLLDGEQKSYESKEPYSTYQFEGYLWQGVPAVCLFVHDGALWFGTEDGRVCAFKTQQTVDAYSDENGSEVLPIECWWTTPLMELDIWGRLKNVTGVWIAGQPYSKSSGKIYYATDKEHERLVREYTVDIFDWNDVDFDRWTFNTLDRPMVVAAGRKAKKVKLFQVKVKNEAVDEPFGLLAMQVDYRVGGRIRR